MLIEKVIKYYDKKFDLNCAECMIIAANEEYDLNISKQTLRAMASFGGGMGIGSVCGAITGAIAVLGVMFTDERGHQSPHVKEMTVKFINSYKDSLKVIDCISLKDKYYEVEDVRCTKMMYSAAKILEEIIQEYKEKYPIQR